MCDTQDAPILTQERERMLDWMTAASPILLIALLYYRWQAAGLMLMAAAGYAAVSVLLQWAGLARCTGTAAVTTGVWTALLLPAAPLWVAGVAGAVAGLAAVLSAVAERWIPRFPLRLPPALMGCLVVWLAFPAYVRAYTWPAQWAPLSAEAVTTPLLPLYTPDAYPRLHLFLGIREGAIGEGCIPVLLMAAAYLLIRRRLRLIAPGAMLATVALLSWMVWGAPLRGILVGCTVLAALLLADRDYAPVAYGPQAVAGVVAGGLAVLLRAVMGQDGCAVGVLIACLLSPLYPAFLQLCRCGALWLWGVICRYVPPAAAWVWGVVCRYVIPASRWLWAQMRRGYALVVVFVREKICKKQK